MRLRRVVLPVSIVAVVLAVLFGFYLYSLSGQLRTAFEHEEQFIPTRIYSDVARVAPPQTRGHIEDKLKALGYKIAATENEVRFTLHPIDYPIYLIPSAHPQADLATSAPDDARRAVVLNFSGADRGDLLQSIQLGGTEIPDLYLEPELVTSLSRGSNAQGKREIRQLVSMDDMDFPSNLWKAILSVEDPHFMDHKGVDPRGLARSIWIDLKTLSPKQGGSTITLQLVKMLMGRKNKNLFRKANEFALALILETKYDKNKILERYLNEVPLGQVGSYEVHGVAEGAELFFGKDFKNLNLAEAAFMAGLIRGPGFYSPYRHYDRALQRQRFVLKRMVEGGYIAEAEAKAAESMPIRLAPPTTVANKAPYFADFAKAELLSRLKDRMPEEEVLEAGFRVYTTLDLEMNAEAQTAVTQGIAALEKKMKLAPADRLEGALASVDHTNGYIRALIGGRSYAQSTFNRILNMRRQVGSTFKPFVYLTAFAKGKDANGVPYGPGHPIEDSPWTLVYDHGRQKWSPKNYEKGYLGWISMRKALAHSINTATARLGYEVGIPDIIETARSLGIESELPAVPSLTLGVAELSPIELLKSYAAIANHGEQDELTVIRAIVTEDFQQDDFRTHYARFSYNPKQVFDRAPIDLLIDMMTSVFTEGTAHEAASMGFDRPAAGKTGTTSHHRDSWFAGFTPQLTTVVWVGMDQFHESAKVNLTGATSALPIWADFMKQALAGEPPTPFPVSPQLSDVSIDMKSGMLADSTCPVTQIVTEKYIHGKEPRSAGCSPLWPNPVHETVAQ